MYWRTGHLFVRTTCVCSVVVSVTALQKQKVGFQVPPLSYFSIRYINYKSSLLHSFVYMMLLSYSHHLSAFFFLVPILPSDSFATPLITLILFLSIHRMWPQIYLPHIIFHILFYIQRNFPICLFESPNQQLLCVCLNYESSTLLLRNHVKTCHPSQINFY